MLSNRILLSALLAAPLAADCQDLPARTDLAGDPLPAGAITRIGTTRFRSTPYLGDIFFTPDGLILVGKGGSDGLLFWEAVTGKTLFELRDPDLTNFAIDHSPDGTLLALFGSDRRGMPAPDTTLRLYDVATRKPIWTKIISDERHFNHAVRFTPDGKRLITGSNDLRVWDVKSGAELARERIRSGNGRIVLSPDGKMVAGADQRRVWVWNWEDAAAARQMDTTRELSVSSLAFSADGKVFYTSDISSIVRAYDVATGKYMGRADESVFKKPAPSPDGKFVAVTEYDKERGEGSVLLRDAATNKELRRLRTGSIAVGGLCWSKDGAKIAGASGFRAYVWDIKTGKSLGPEVAGPEAAITSLEFTGNGELISASEDHTIRTWEPVTGKELHCIRLNHAFMGGVTCSPDGDVFAGSLTPGEVHVWQAKTGKEAFHLVWSTSRTGSGAYKSRFTADGQTLVTFSLDWYVRTWDMLTGKLKSERSVRPAEFGPLDDERDNFLETIPIVLAGVALSPDGESLYTPSGKSITAYSVSTGKEKFKLEANVSELALSPDGKFLVTLLRGNQPTILPKGAMPAAVSNEATIWNLNDAKPIARFSVPGRVDSKALAFTPDSKRVVTTSADGMMRFWDTASGEAAGTIELPRKPRAIAFGGDKWLAVAFADPSIVIYDLAAALKPAKKE
jgi:WD40 repeat protein